MAEKEGFGALWVGHSPHSLLLTVATHKHAALFESSILYYFKPERGGFEPPNPFGLHAFEARAFDHSAISPNRLIFE